MEFKDMLKYLREREHMSQRTLAKKIGVSPSAVGNYESGIRTPDFTIEEAIADLFNVSLDVLRGKCSAAAAAIPVYDTLPYDFPDRIPFAKGHEMVSNSEDINDYFGMIIKDDAMAPTICLNDLIIIHRQSTAKNGDIIVASVNRADCICRHFIKYKQNLVILRPDNRTYTEIDAGGTELKIFGRVTEIRRKL